MCFPDRPSHDFYHQQYQYVPMTLMSRKIALNNNCQSNPSKSEGCEHNAKVPTTLGNIKYTWIPSMTQWPSTFTHFQFTVRHFHSFPSGRPRFGVVKLAPYLAFLRSKSWPRLTIFFCGKGPIYACCLMWLSYFMALHGYLFPRSDLHGPWFMLGQYHFLKRYLKSLSSFHQKNLSCD